MLKLLANLSHIVGVGCHSHNAANAHVFHCLEDVGIQYFLGFIHAETEFRFLFRNVELQQAIDHNVVFCSLFVDGL